MTGFIGKSVVRLATLAAALVIVGCGDEAGLCYLPEQEDAEELAQSECTDRGGTWQPLERNIVGV